MGRAFHHKTETDGLIMISVRAAERQTESKASDANV